MTPPTRREFLQASVAAAVTGTLLPGLSGCTQEALLTSRRPNLLFVFPDQMRGQAMGFVGEDPAITPNLDRFSTEGVVFTQAVSNYPVCSPYRAILFTGRWPYQQGVIDNNIRLKPAETTLGEVFKKAGYATGYIGKWHLGGIEQTHGNKHLQQFIPPGPARQGVQ